MINNNEILDDGVIKLLPDFIANQIAAGEVVQRPESVVKELVENSLDAGADSIVVSIRGAGKTLIHIVDNGAGMSRNDLALACLRHSTSKIRTSSDLESISTFGFRGEALASICSVAQVEIRTKRAQDEHGWRLISEPLKEAVIEPFNCDVGTQIFVKNLFYNTPARRKFLKSDITEFRHISDAMIKFALSKPDIRITFYDENELIFDLQKAPLLERIAGCLGKNLGEEALEVDFTSPNFIVTGYVGNPNSARQTKTSQYLFLNTRSIVNKQMSHAIFSAYEKILEKAAQPYFVLNIEIDPRKVDINVHPQKHEVKFDDERAVYGAVLRAVTLALEKGGLATSANFFEKSSRSPYQKIEFINNSGEREYALVNSLTGEVAEAQEQRYEEPRKYSNYSGASNYTKNYSHQINQSFGALKERENESLRKLYSREDEPRETANISRKNGKYWLLHRKYIFIETSEGVRVIDQHAAHERVLYEKAVKAMDRELAYSQRLLFPMEIELSATEISLIKEFLGNFENLGFEIAIASPTRLKLLGAPSDIKSGMEVETLKEILSDLVSADKTDSFNSREHFAATYACKAAIKTGDELNDLEIDKLVQDLFSCSMPYSCPHGRPIIMDIKLGELDLNFKRT